MESSGDFISEGEIVLLRKNDVYKPVTLTKGRKVSFERMSFLPDAAIGKRYGSEFQVRSHILVPYQRVDTASHYVEGGGASGTSSGLEGKDNSTIVDDGTSQALTHQDIHIMKEKGTSGQEILESVIQGSSSFKEKTSYSQEKYVRKKEKKHIPIISIVKPSTRLLCIMYYSKSPSKICHLRVDTLARMLTYSNVHAGVNALVVETCQGLLMGAVLERLGGMGSAVQIFFGDKPVWVALNNFGHLTDKDRSIHMTYPYQRVFALKDTNTTISSSKDTNDDKETVNTSLTEEQRDGNNVCAESSLTINDESKETHQQDDQEQMETNQGGDTASDNESDHDMSYDQVITDTTPLDKPTASSSPPLKKFKSSTPQEGGEKDCSNNDTNNEDKDNDEEEEPVSKEKGRHGGKKWEEEKKVREERRRLKEEGYQRTASFLSSTPMDCLLIATRFHPEPILKALLPFVAPSRPVIVYSQLQETLVSCYKMLRERGDMFNLQLSETWLRHYQVLPGRTHPAVTMDGQSGFLLIGTTILPPPPRPPHPPHPASSS